MHPDDFEAFNYDSSMRTDTMPEGVLLPIEYLRFAVLDLAEGNSERHLTNSTSNAKKALHLQVDIIAEVLGFKAGRSVPFPKKLDFCTSCGVGGSRILEKLNRLRNSIEHEYLVPTKEQTEDFVDVVELFLSGTNLLLRLFPEEMTLVDECDDEVIEEAGLRTNDLTVEWQPRSGVIVLEGSHLTIAVEEIRALVAIEEASLIEKHRSRKLRKDRLRALKNDAYCKVIQQNRKNEQLSIPASDRSQYCAWAKWILRKSGVKMP